MNSALVVDKATQVCFWDFQLIGVEKRKVTKPVIDWQSCAQAQSESEKEIRSSRAVDSSGRRSGRPEMRRPREEVVLQ